MEKENCRGDNKGCWVTRNPFKIKEDSNILSLETPILDNVPKIDMPKMDEESKFLLMHLFRFI